MAARKNPGGGPKSDKPWRDALMLAVNDIDPVTKAKRLRRIAEAVVEAAMSGDMQAAREIGDRLDGKPRQEAEVKHEHSGDITHKHEPVSATAEWIAETLGSGSDREAKKSLPH